MKAVILAAGCGKRMGELTKDHPKAMLRLQGKPLIEWQMQAMQQAGITDIAIITGYKGNVFDYPVNYFNNYRWNQTSMLSTLMCAGEWLDNDTCIVSYSDIVYSSDAISKLRNAPGDVVITFDPHWLQLWQQRFDDPLSDAEIFKYDHNTLLDIGGKADSLYEIQGQYMGLLKFSIDGWKKIKEILLQLPVEMVDKMDMTSLLKLMIKNDYKISVVSVDTPWCEIDNAHDYQLCQRIFREKISIE